MLTVRRRRDSHQINSSLAAALPEIRYIIQGFREIHRTFPSSCRLHSIHVLTLVCKFLLLLLTAFITVIHIIITCAAAYLHANEQGPFFPSGFFPRFIYSLAAKHVFSSLSLFFLSDYSAELVYCRAYNEPQFLCFNFYAYCCFLTLLMSCFLFFFLSFMGSFRVSLQCVFFFLSSFLIISQFFFVVLNVSL